MITFKNFLSEARMAPLYHGTSSGSFRGILEDGFMPTTFHENSKLNLNARKPNNTVSLHSQKGVSFTRSFKFAKSWGAIVFEVDQQKLNHRYKIVPIQYWQSDGVARKRDEKGTRNEYEEFALASTYIPMNVVVAIHYRTNSSGSIFDQGISAKDLSYAKDKYPNIQFKEIK